MISKIFIFLLLEINIYFFISFKYTKHNFKQRPVQIRNINMIPTKLQNVLNELQININQVAQLAAKKAGIEILNGKINLNSDDIQSKIGSRDVVTEVDKKCQEIIKDTILAKFPTHEFLGEEDIAPGIEASKAAIQRYKDVEHLWIVDPIDGTTNFAHGMLLSGVIIAYASYGITQYGLIYDPYHNETFTAYLNNGAYMNNEPIHCCNTNLLSNSVIATGSPPNIKALEACLRGTQHISHKVRTMRMLGSAAIMLSWVAIGRLTAYFEADLNVWDLAAGSLLIQESGGIVSDCWGNNYTLSTRNLVATNGIIHKELLEQMIESEMFIK